MPTLSPDFIFIFLPTRPNFFVYTHSDHSDHSDHSEYSDSLWIREKTSGGGGKK